MVRYNLNLSSEKDSSPRSRVVVHDEGTVVVYVGSWEWLVYLGVRFVSIVQC